MPRGMTTGCAWRGRCWASWRPTPATAGHWERAAAAWRHVAETQGRTYQTALTWKQREHHLDLVSRVYTELAYALAGVGELRLAAAALERGRARWASSWRPAEPCCTRPT
ncbi:hypothetical protein BE21_25780 [Sorangium cellulosum]|uniref:Uncharacterized protein n=1 Tax=Sorangium cellulosum TaxID=56 RepID=A0A150TTU1_SORCE|nr:hypothetical protein BE21_25780 [Sorangium cellulosum]